MFSKIKGIVKNPYTLSILSKMFGVLIGFLFTIFQSRYLGAEIKGQVATVNSIVSIGSILLGFGIYYAYPYYKRNTQRDIMPVFMKLALLLLAVYSVISALAMALLRLPPKYFAVCMITPLLTYDGIVSYITLIEKPNRKSLTDMAVVFSELLVLLVLWKYAPPTFYIGVFIITLKSLAQALLFTGWWRKRIFVSGESLREWIPKLMRFGFFPMLSLLMTTLNYRVDVLMLDGKVSDAAIGVYSVGVLLAERIWIIPDAMKGVMVSHLAKGKDARETAYVIRICNSVCLIIVIGIIALGEPFLDFVFGAEYHGAYQVTLILLAGVFSMIYYKLIAAYNIAMGKQMISFVLLAVSVACNIVANLLLIPGMGIYGAGLASIISYALCSVLFVVYFCRETKIPFTAMLFINKADYARLKAKLVKKKNTQ